MRGQVTALEQRCNASNACLLRTGPIGNACITDRGHDGDCGLLYSRLRSQITDPSEKQKSMQACHASADLQRGATQVACTETFYNLNLNSFLGFLWIFEILKTLNCLGDSSGCTRAGEAGGVRLPGERGVGEEVPRAVRAVRAAAVQAAPLRLWAAQHPLRSPNRRRLQTRQPRQVRVFVYCHYYHTLFLPRGKVRPADKLQLKAATILPLVGLARSMHHPINRGHGAQYLYRPPPAGAVSLFTLN